MNKEKQHSLRRIGYRRCNLQLSKIRFCGSYADWSWEVPPTPDFTIEMERGGGNQASKHE
jgi:hypothetical protein